MCLVSYIPTKEGFVLSSNRDESPLRSAEHVELEVIKDEQIYYPVDVKGGSWIMVSDKRRIVCVLNGAFVNHVSNPPYKMSRGLVSKAFFKYENAVDFFEKFDFWNIEPFTMIIYDHPGLYEFKWDGAIKNVTELDTSAKHVWSSCTLYDAPAQREREQALRQNLDTIDIADSHSLINAHLAEDKENLYNGLYMDRNDVIKTISHTQIKSTNQGLNLLYFNLVTDQKEIVSII